MVSFTVSMLWWLACALFRSFLLVWTGYGIYRFIKDRIEDKERCKYLDECQKKHEEELKEAKERISRKVKKSN